MIVVTYRLFDLNIDIGKILGDVGGLLFSSRKDGNDTNTNEETAEGELGNILVYLQLISISNLSQKCIPIENKVLSMLFL